MTERSNELSSTTMQYWNEQLTSEIENSPVWSIRCSSPGNFPLAEVVGQPLPRFAWWSRDTTWNEHGNRRSSVTYGNAAVENCEHFPALRKYPAQKVQSQIQRLTSTRTRVRTRKFEAANELISDSRAEAARKNDFDFEARRVAATLAAPGTHPCLSNGSSTSTRSADPRAVLISRGKPRLRPPGFFGANWLLEFPSVPGASRFRVIFGRARPPPEMSHPTVRRTPWSFRQ